MPLQRGVIELTQMGYEDRPRSGGGDFNRGPREQHKAVCSDCKKETTVPFKPTEGRPVYCRDCFPKHSAPRPNRY